MRTALYIGNETAFACGCSTSYRSSETASMFLK